jgi:hypothetical protein
MVKLSMTVGEKLDDSDLDMLAEMTFNNGLSDEDYEQTLEFEGGEFNYALRDEVSGVRDISDNVFFEAGSQFATYTLDLRTAIDLDPGSYTTSDMENDFVGEEIVIMGNTFTIAEIRRDGSDLDQLTLIGGANKISLGEGESTVVTVDGTSYDVSVQNVDTDTGSNTVLLTVNGNTRSIDEYETEDISGVSIAVTDLVGSSRDSVKGYAEIVIGGQKVTLFDGNKEVEVNDKDVSDVHTEYRVKSDFSDSGAMDTITISYVVDDDTSLEEGDMLSDVLFGGFDLVFKGTNEPSYSTIEVRSDDDDVTVEGTLENGAAFGDPYDSSGGYKLYHYDGGNSPTGHVYLRGANNEDVLFAGVSNGIDATGITFESGVDVTVPGEVTFDVTDTGILGSGFLLFDDNENQYLYRVESIDVADTEVDLEEFLDGQDEQRLAVDSWGTDLEQIFNATNTVDTVTIDYSELGNVIAFENEALLTLLLGYDNDFTETQTDVFFTIGLDSGDVNGDEGAEENDLVEVILSFDNTDDEFDVKLNTGHDDIVNKGVADISEDNSDVQEFVTRYGIKVEYDNQDSRYLKVMIPDEQVEGELVVRTGGTSQRMTVVVDSDAVEDKKAELEADGYTIYGEDTMSSEEVTFDVSAPMLDSEVTGNEDMIVVGGPAVNRVAADLLGMSYPAYREESGLMEGDAVIRYFEAENSVLVYGWESGDTRAAVNRLNDGGLSGSSVNVQ